MPAVSDSKYLVNAGWDDVPHLDDTTKRELLAETPPHLRDARSKGIPSLGSGAIYPIAESEFVVDPFRIPPHWPRGYGLDDGWNRTAALWSALDRDTDTLYFTAEHYRGQAEPAIHAAAILARGDWIPGVGDAAARARDGEQIIEIYRGLGLDLILADKEVEAGIYDMWLRLSTGRLKVFRTLANFLAEYRVYRRDEQGRIVKEFDHLMDCGRYLCRPSAIARMKLKPAERGTLPATPIGDRRIGY